MIFLKASWRFIMGLKDVLVLCFLLLFFATLYAALTLTPGERPARVHEGALLLDLNGTVVEQPRTLDPMAALAGGRAPTAEYRLRDIVDALTAARTDPKVKAVVLNLDGFLGGGQVALTRIGTALDAVRAAGKPVLAYATAYEDDGYQLAAHAGEIWLNPLGGVALTGPGGTQLYYKGLIDRLGITANIYRVGTYKSAVEPFLRADQSPEARQANQALAQSLWANWQQEVGRARPRAQIARYSADPVAMAEGAHGNLAQAALAAGLVDKLDDSAAFEARVAALAGKARSATDGAPTFAAIDLRDYARAHAPAAGGAVGVLTVAGEIVDGEATPGTAGGDTIVAQLNDALAQGRLKALVVRVDSPGGSVLASERIRRALVAARARGLPVVVSMGNVAASGGYWISTPANRILAEPATITGSIGVFGVLPSFEGMLAKIGITTDGVKTTPLSGEPNILGGVSPEFGRVAQLGVEDMYRRFLALVAGARHMTPQAVDRLAQGRVWDGASARRLGLVDGYGTLDDAVALAAKLAKLTPDEARASYIEPKADPFSRLVEQWMEQRSGGGEGRVRGDLLARQAIRQQALLNRAVADARRLATGASIQAACLECAAYDGATAAAPGPADARALGARWRLALSLLAG